MLLRLAAAGLAPPRRGRLSESPELRREIGALDGALLTVGAVIGTGIFYVGADIARALPHPGLALLVWVVAGLWVLAGALSYGELGASFPRAGGIYHFLKEAYGPLWGFLYGWTAFFVIMSGGIAAIATGFATSLAGWLPAGSSVKLIACLTIVALTAVQHVGLKPGMLLGNGLTVLKIAAILAFVAFGALAEPRVEPELLAPVGPGLGLAAFGVAMIAALWTYDGWYGLTFSAGEMRRPERELPRALLLGCAATVALYVALSWVYLRALPLSEMATSQRVGEDAAAALLGSTGGRLFSLAVLVSSLGCLAITILYSSRIYLPMAQDGVFFARVATIHPRWRTPTVSLWAQSAWALLLVLSGTYEELTTYVVFAGVLFHAACGMSLFVLRRRQPGLPRPYRVWGYPLVPALFVLGCLLLTGNTLAERPKEALAGLALVALGLPAYALWRRRT